MRRDRVPAKWQASIGTDKAQAAEALRLAAAQGRTLLAGTAAEDVLSLPAPNASIPLLSAAPDDAGPVPAAKLAALQAIRERLLARMTAPAVASDDARAKRVTAELRGRARRAADAYAVPVREETR